MHFERGVWGLDVRCHEGFMRTSLKHISSGHLIGLAFRVLAYW